MRQNKYKAKRVTADGRTFDSKKEYRRYLILQQMEKEGVISALRQQVQYELIPKQKDADGKAVRAAVYTADFVYDQGGALVVEDVKSAITRKKADYVLRKKLMLWRYGITIKET